MAPWMMANKEPAKIRRGCCCFAFAVPFTVAWSPSSVSGNHSGVDDKNRHLNDGDGYIVHASDSGAAQAQRRARG